MILFAILAGCVLLLAVFFILFAATAVAVWGNSYLALAVGAAFGFFWWHVAVYGPPERADGQHG